MNANKSNSDQIMEAIAERDAEFHKPTAGPWRAWRSLADNSINVSNAEAEFVCMVGRMGDDYDEGNRMSANARLIAAAPDLLAALERIANESCDHGPGFCARDLAREVLAKAVRS